MAIQQILAMLGQGVQGDSRPWWQRAIDEGAAQQGNFRPKMGALDLAEKQGRRGPIMEMGSSGPIPVEELPLMPREVAPPQKSLGFMSGIADMMGQGPAPSGPGYFGNLVNKMKSGQAGGPSIDAGPMAQQVIEPVQTDNPGVRVEAPWRHMDESEHSANARYLANLNAAVSEQASQARLAEAQQHNQYQSAGLLQRMAALDQENQLRNKEFGLQQQKFEHQKGVDDFLRSPSGLAQRDTEAMIKANTGQGIAQNLPQIITDIRNARIRASQGQPQPAGPVGQLGPLLELLGTPDQSGKLPPIDAALEGIFKREQLQPGMLTNERLAALNQVIQQMYPPDEYKNYLNPQASTGQLIGGFFRTINPFLSNEELTAPYAAKKFFRERLK